MMKKKIDIFMMFLAIGLVCTLAIAYVTTGSLLTSDTGVRFVEQTTAETQLIQSNLAHDNLSSASVSSVKQPAALAAMPVSAPLKLEPTFVNKAATDPLGNFSLGAITGLNSNLNLAQVSIEEVNVTVDLPFEELHEYSDLLPYGQEEIVQYGQNGQLLTKVRNIYHDGVLFQQEELAHTVSQQAVAQVLRIGTYVEEIESTALEFRAAGAESEAEATSPESSAEEEVEAQLAPLEAEAQQPAPQFSPYGFTAPGSVSAAQNNFNIIASLLHRNGLQNYYSFQDNGNGTITVDGITFPLSTVVNWTTTCYDGYECAKLVDFQYGDCNPTASGILAQRGIVAAAMGGLPFGTVVFVEGYGLAVVADRHGMGANFMDLSMDAREISQGFCLETASRNIYILYIPE